MVLHALSCVNRFFRHVVFSLRQKRCHYLTNKDLSIQSLVQTQPDFVYIPPIIWYIVIFNNNSQNLAFFFSVLSNHNFWCFYLPTSSTHFVSFQNLFNCIMEFEENKNINQLAQLSLLQQFQHSVNFRLFSSTSTSSSGSKIIPFKLVDVGEGIVEVEIVKWHIKEGDHIKGTLLFSSSNQNRKQKLSSKTIIHQLFSLQSSMV